jgi:hypothetical protein
MPGIFVTRFNAGRVWNGGTCLVAAQEVEWESEAEEARAGEGLAMEDVVGRRGVERVWYVAPVRTPRIPVSWRVRQSKRVDLGFREACLLLKLLLSMRSKRLKMGRIFRGVLSEGWRKDSQ